MKSLTSSLLLHCLFVSTLLQYLNANRRFNKLNQDSIDKLYDVHSSEVNTSGKWYDVRIESKEENLLPYGIPSLLDFGKYEEKDAIILDLIGDNLMKSVTDNSDKSPQYYGTVCLWAKQIITALQFLHKRGYVHQDVQPENIAEGVENFDPNRTDVSFKGRTYLCNLGQSYAYKYGNGTSKTPRRQLKLDIRGFNETPYAPRSSIEKFLAFPRDDLESLGYTILSIAAGVLPWSNLSPMEMWKTKNTFFKNDQALTEVCKQMAISDMGMTNAFRNFFKILRLKYFDVADVSYKREIDYEDLSDCFVYPARPVLYFGHLNPPTIDKIYRVSKVSANVTFSVQYKVMRLGENEIPNMQKGVMVKTAIEDETFVRNTIKVFKDLYSISRERNLLPFHIPNMLGYGMYEGKRIILLDLLGVDLMELTTNNADDDPRYYDAVCFWARQTIEALKFLHQHKYVHRNIKPENIVAGAVHFDLNRTDVSFMGSVYLFNFGMAERYKYDNGTIRMKEQKFEFPCATSPYSSRATLGGYTHYPRDDMEELGYTLLTITAGALPWSYLSVDDIEQKNSVLRNSHMVEAVCKSMGMVDMGMINVFKRYFALLNTRYFADDDYSREINYEELSACFVYQCPPIIATTICPADLTTTQM